MTKDVGTLDPEPLPALATLACSGDEPEWAELRAAVGLMTPPASREDCAALLRLASLALDFALCPTITADDPSQQGEAEAEHVTKWMLRARQGINAATSFLDSAAAGENFIVALPLPPEEPILARSSRLRELAALTCQRTETIMARLGRPGAARRR